MCEARQVGSQEQTPGRRYETAEYSEYAEVKLQAGNMKLRITDNTDVRARKYAGKG